MLTSKDLMIGDWYTLRGQPHKCTASDIAFIAECEEKGVSTDISEIPLTHGILEKNGFRQGCYVGGYLSPDCPFRVFTKTDGKCGFTTLFDDEIHFSCVFVHELQHAIRLCGIEYEITL